MKKILVTGGCGFVGRNLIKKLLESKNTDIWIVDDLSIGIHPDKWLDKNYLKKKSRKDEIFYIYKKNNNKVHFVNKDILSIFLSELNRQKKVLNFKFPQFNEVYHLASIVGGRAVIDGDPLLVGIDLAIDSVFFLWAGKINKPNRILYTSSSAAYPISIQTKNKNIALKESMINFENGFSKPDMTYGWSKLTGEYLATIAVKQYGLKVGVVRPFSGYGADQDLSYPVPSIALRVANKDNPVFVWGDGNQKRDFVYISDCIDICIKVCRKVKDGDAFNIGIGKGISFKTLAKELIKLEKYRAVINTLKKKPIGVMNRFSNNNKIYKKFGWKPKISLQEGLSKVLDQAHKRLDKGIKPSY
jgi:UDP-glucose 4-epimerase